MPKKIKILVVDDSRVVRKAFAKILGPDYEVVDTGDGEKAWDILNQDDEVCAVYADLDMPEPNAHALLKRLRSSDNKEIHSLPFIVIASESDDERSRRVVLDAGATDFISKPFDSVSLTASAKSHVRPNENSLSYIKDATLDPLTQLANKAYFLSRGAQEMSLTNRHGVEMGVILIAIDDFNGLLENHDRKMIKILLRGIGAYLLDIVRHEDIVARVDKEIYAVLMPHTDLMGCQEAAVRILKSLRAKIHRSEVLMLKVSFSIGVAASNSVLKRTFEMLLKGAEEQLAQALKEDGDSIAPDNADVLELSKSSKKPLQTISLDEALVLISRGDRASLHGQEAELLSKVLPIIMFCDQQLDLGLVTELTRVGNQYDVVANGQ